MGLKCLPVWDQIIENVGSAVIKDERPGGHRLNYVNLTIMAEEPRYTFHRRPGVVVSKFEDDLVLKEGSAVRPAERLAMDIVLEHTNVPVPTPMASAFKPRHGQILMTLVEGVRLEDVWQDLDVGTTTSLCQQIWSFVAEWRRIPKPIALQHLYACSVEGKLGQSGVITDGGRSVQEKDSDIVSDEALRRRICENYYKSFGSNNYSRAQANLFEMLPPSSKPSVFTHGDLQAKNIMVSGGQVTCILDWEYAGWYPEYWEYIGITAACYDNGDYAQHMMACAPQTWDLRGIFVAAKMLV